MLSIAILAAGRSQRFGSNKMLLPLTDGQTLLGHCIDQCAPLSPSPVMVISGAYHNALSQHDFARPIQLIHNANWEQGMATSIHEAVAYTQTLPKEVTHLLITLGDLPLVTTSSLNSLWEVAKTQPETIIASFWEGKATAPAIFPRCFWPLLTQLSGDKGAGILLQDAMAQSPPACIPVPHAEARVDIDTPQTYREFLG
ncbi:nucleotidyltransferase family protein [Salinimonas marina]|uniref:Nucleotidyltransferase family protein n=1 Tax=Salinimonas marina TaxID=2785918 RepID=A0A7S9DVB2_9ALTE|nr:nucleotidyltransferase family protein [Salinimonas marina]QPG04413.1 nucleotidyltransferase family protein [Salinimonas marina]